VSVFSSRCVATLDGGMLRRGAWRRQQVESSTAQTPQNRPGGDRSNDVRDAILDCASNARRILVSKKPHASRTEEPRQLTRRGHHSGPALHRHELERRGLPPPAREMRVPDPCASRVPHPQFRAARREASLGRKELAKAAPTKADVKVRSTKRPTRQRRAS
jgi:hypothetical protein